MTSIAAAQRSLDATRGRAAGLSRRTAHRALLISGSLVVPAVVAAIGAPETRAALDPDLARMLRGMALLKAVLTLAAVGVLLWRLGHPMSTGLLAIYFGATWAMATATLLIWQLVLLPAAALAFHAGELALLLAAWRDGGLRKRRGARSPG